MPTDVKITTELLYQGMLIFALMDLIFVSILTWRVKRESFHGQKWTLPLAAALVWFGIWRWAIGIYWETVYAYVFPAWGQVWIPIIAFFAAGLIAVGLWLLAIRSRWNPVLVYCLFGGLLGSLTHIWAVLRGIVIKPPMLQGASPLAATVFAFFEYILYWCVILVLALGINWIYHRLNHSK